MEKQKTVESINEEVRKWFCRIAPLPYPGIRKFTATEEMLIQEMTNWIVSELFQYQQLVEEARVAALEWALKAVVYPNDLDMAYKYISEEIARLKQSLIKQV